MQLLAPVTKRPNERGAALMLAILVLFVLIMIVFQITMGSSTDSRVAKNDLQLTVFDAAIESALLKSMEDLATDAAESGDGGGAAPGGGLPGIGAPDGGGEEEEAGPVDSRRDEWARPQQTEINGVSLRILVQDENSKYNILTMLVEDVEEADKAFERVVRVLDLCREGTLSDIDESTARNMADEMREFMRSRDNASLPRPSLLTDREEGANLGLPMSLREFVVLPSFNEFMFRDFRDADGQVVHSISTFLTTWTSLSTYQEYRSDIESEVGSNVGAADQAAPTEENTTPTAGNGVNGVSSGNSTDPGGEGQGGLGGASGDNAGYAVNVNTATNAVLHAISDRSDISWDFLDEVVRYRNLEDEEETDPDADPVYDEYGEEVIIRQIFDDVEELADVDGWETMEPNARDDFQRFMTVESSVFSIYVTARASTARDADSGFGLTRAEAEELAERGTDRLRTIRVTVWRYDDGDEVRVVPLEGWEIMDYSPFEVLDYPDEDR